jgi:hypothetical protein
MVVCAGCAYILISGIGRGAIVAHVNHNGFLGLAHMQPIIVGTKKTLWLSSVLGERNVESCCKHYYYYYLCNALNREKKMIMQ